jgi:hypothetical protein
MSRLERGLHAGLDLDDLQRLATAMGGRFRIQLDAPFLADRSVQRDRVHGRCIGYAARRLRRDGWAVESEVEISGSAGPGWIDLLGWDPSSRALLVIEIKTEIVDFGRIQRTLGWYQSCARVAAQRFGWFPRTTSAALLLLDSRTVADRLRDNRDLARVAFPQRARDIEGFVRDSARRNGGLPRALAMIDPLNRRSTWLRPSVLDGRRSAPTYLDYADAARRLSR